MALIVEVDLRRKTVAGAGGSRRTILADIAFALEEREIVAVLGPSGCGKTTLLRFVGGLEEADEGRIAWRPGPRPRIGTVFQEPRLLPWRTVAENLALVRPPDRAAVRQIAEDLGLAAHMNAYPAALSLGLARRVAITRAFAVAPELLLLDEPFVSLDADLAERSRQALLDVWRRRPTAALIVTHDRAEAAALADRILVLSSDPARIAASVVVPERERRRGIARGAALAAELLP